MKKRTTSKPAKRKRTARFEITFTVEVEIREPSGRKGWQPSDDLIDVEEAVAALVDEAPDRPFRHDRIAITDTLGFTASFLEEVEAD